MPGNAPWRLVEQVVETAPCGMVIVDPEGRIELVNAELERIFGYRREELLGSTIDRLVPSRVRGEHAALRASFLRDPSARPMGSGRDLTGVRKDGTEVPVEVGLSPVATTDGLRVLGTIVDITERARLLADLASSTEALRRSNEDLERFAEVAAHDLRAPLREVTDYTAKLEARCAKLDPASVAYASLARESAARMERMVEDLLAYARVDQDRSSHATVPLAAALEAATARLRGALEASGAQLEVGPLPDVVGQAELLASVFQNLLDNAIKFAGDGPPRIRIDATRVDARVVVAVRDEGLGIDPAELVAVFKLFRRLHHDDAIPGSGMGLALVERAVAAHSGSIRAESDGRRGTAFVFDLPAAAAG